MTGESTQLLRMLGSGVRPSSGAGAAMFGGSGGFGAAGSIDSAPFAELLKQAETGELSSHRRVSVENGTGIELNEAQSLALSAAADRAEAAGIRRALVLLDDHPLLLDVNTRTIMGRGEFNKGVLSGVDGVLKISSSTTAAGVGGAGGAGAQAGASILPLPKAMPTQLLNRTNDETK